MVDYQAESDEEPRFKYISLTKLDIEVQVAREKNKYCLIFDKSSNAHVFFSYKASLKDFHKEVIAC